MSELEVPESIETINESEQLTRAKVGDGVAWEAIIRQHQEAVFRLAYLLLRDADDAADVAQETFIRAYHSLDHFDTTRPLRPWLLEITRNQAFNWSRSLRRRLVTLQRWGASVPLSGSIPGASMASEPNEEVMQQWKATELWQAICRLNGSDQEVVYLRCFLELSVEETAQVLRVAPGTVKSRLSRALDRLRRVVEQEFPGLREEASQ